MKKEKLLKKFSSEINSIGLDDKTALDIIEDVLLKIKGMDDRVVMYRIVFLDNLKDLNYETVGSHYSLNKENLIDSMYSKLIDSAYGETPYLLTVKLDKKLIDVDKTISNNILYPNEEEITIIDNGSKVKILNIEKLSNEHIQEITKIKSIMNLITEETSEQNLIGKRVMVYYNLHKHTFSITLQGKVVKYADYVKLSDVEFRVRSGGKERVIKEKKKNVHAFVIGNLLDFCDYPCENIPEETNDNIITYNPYKYDSFVRKDNEEPIFNANEIDMINRRNKLFLIRENH